jgi:hypothetical protein
MKFIVVGDIERAEQIKKLSALDLRQYSFVLLTGDMSGTPEGWKIGRARGLGDKSFIPKGESPKKY